MSFQAEMRASLGWTWNEGAIDSGRLDFAALLLEGNGENQAEAVWHREEQSLDDGTSVTFDLSALTRTVMSDNHTVTFLTIKALLIVNHAASDGTLVVGGAASNEWSEPFAADGDQVLVPPESPILLANRRDGWNVLSTDRNLKLATSDGAVDYSIAVLGTVTAG